MRGLLPGDEGTAWLAEVTCCLAEAHDKGERCRYVRSYRRGVPQLIWTSWALRLFVLGEGRDGQWWRGFLVVALTGLLGVALIGALALAGWVGGALCVIAGVAALARHRRQPSSERHSRGG